MEKFDKIIADKLGEAKDFTPNAAMWNNITKALDAGAAQVSSPFTSAFFSGVAATVILGVFFTQLPSMAPNASTPLIVASEIETVQPAVQNIQPFREASKVDNDFDPQEMHDIVFASSETKSIPQNAEQVALKSALESNDHSVATEEHAQASTKQNSEQLASTGSEVRFDFRAKGIQCLGKTISFQVQQYVNDVEWIIDGVQVLYGSAVDFTFEEEGMHEVTMIVKTNGKRASVKKEIEIYSSPAPIVDVNVESSPSCLKQVAHLTAQPGDNTYSWTVNGEQAKGSSVDIPLQDGSYEVSLRAINAYGCVSEYSELLTIESALDIHIPSGFSPQNNDGTNDNWFPVGLEQCDHFTVRVFDFKTKAMVFETTELSGWDGRIAQSTERAQRGDQFYYEVLAADACGFTKRFEGMISVR